MPDLTNASPLPEAAEARFVNIRIVRTLRGYPKIVLVIALALAVVMLPPLIYLFQVSFYKTNFDGSFGELTTSYYTELLTNPRFFGNLLNTFIYAAGSATLAIIIGLFLAWIVERTNTPFRQYMFLVAILSLGTPQVLYTIAWLLILGKAGPVNELFRAAFGTDRIYIDVYSMWGMILVEGFTWGPLSFLLLSSVFRSSDSSFEEASIMSGAGLAQTLRRVTIPLAAPAVFALILLIVIRSFESFEIPALIGMPGRVQVLTTDIYDAVYLSMPANYGQAGAFSVFLLLLVAVMLRFYNRLARSADRFQTITGKGFRPRVLDLGIARYVTLAVLMLFVLILIILPIGILLLASLQRFYETVNAKAFSNMTLQNYVEVVNSSSFRDVIINSVILGAASATATCLITSVIAWLAVRRYPGAWLLDQMATAPLIVPSIVMGVAFMQLYLNLPFPFYGTLASIVLASTVQYLPYGMRYSYAGVIQLHSGLEEAAAICGASGPSIFFRVVIPLILPALISCWLFVFLLSVRAVSMVILLAGPNSKVMAITLFELWANGQTPELAAMGFTWLLFMTCLSGLFYFVARRYGLVAS